VTHSGISILYTHLHARILTKCIYACLVNAEKIDLCPHVISMSVYVMDWNC